jgi:primosomal protein N' (replication factor Y)
MKPRMDEKRNDGRARAVFMVKAPKGSRAGYVNEYMAFRDRMIENRAPAFIEIDINPYGAI